MTAAPELTSEDLTILADRTKTDKGAEPVAALEASLRRFVWFPYTHHYTIATLWATYTHLLTYAEGLPIAPRLGIFSGAPGSGKTVALDLLSKLSANGQPVGSLSSAAMLRVISQASQKGERGQYPVTLFPDELDNVYSASNTQEELTNILNQGYKRGLVIRRADNNDQTKLVDYDCFAPVAFAGLATAKLPDALLSRTFVVHTKKARREESPERYFAVVHDAEMEAVRARVNAWSENAAAELESPQALVAILTDERITAVTNGREHDLWSALFTVAYLAGGNWIDRCLEALDAAKDDASERVTESTSLRLLAALRDFYESQPPISRRKSAAYEDIVEIALERDNRTFGRFHIGPDPEFCPADVQPLLAEHGLKSKQARTAAGKKSRGYSWADLRDAWERVLPAYLLEPEPEPEDGDAGPTDIFGQPR